MARPKSDSATPGPLTPSDIVLRRIRTISESQGLSISALAQRLLEHGFVISDNRLWNLVSGRTKLHVDTLFAIAAALGVSPLALQTMPTDSDEEIQPAPGVQVSPSRFNAWMTGTAPLPGSSKSAYAEHHPYEAQLGRFRGDLDERAQALALRLASHADEAASAAEVLRAQALQYAAALLEGSPSEDVLRSAEALSKRLGIDLRGIERPGHNGRS
ncbi:helix-turn-helix domain-containing protein [Glycomyces niveus]|uniref:Helix-turn-helix transcriptional regulator n=1 Tax=Glycomyces niveus TaxID=2820287 RepID=A0ABS3U1W2_9ACTN|nr:helix-turn-helix transcriptional regulator [Glycomyces sp. NEAU-S30]MBO3732762.1 helix-turn-helix transcriptional regulator [Glycomyces sp. NEAU-S30]